jgi:hypothetical protein
MLLLVSDAALSLNQKCPEKVVPELVNKSEVATNHFSSSTSA